jgi:glycosyltransferase involved in cell wall biosynthesis
MSTNGAEESETPASEPRISVCIMTWNEPMTVASVVEEQLAVLKELGVTHEILIIDDGSTDETRDIVDQLDAKHPAVRVVRHAQNMGLGGVYRTGLREAKGKFITFFPADGQFPASILQQYYPLAEAYDLVLGNLGRRDSMLGAVLTRAERLVNRALVGKIPRLEGVFMLRRSVLTRFPLVSDGRGWAIVWELLIRAQGAKCAMIGVQTALRPRAHGKSKVSNWRYIQANLRQLAGLRKILRDNPSPPS